MWRAIAVMLVMLAGCGSDGGEPDLGPQAPPVGRGAEFRPPSLGDRAVRGLAIKGMRCDRSRRPRFGVHLELFARGHVVLVAPGVGIAPPRARDGAYVRGGRCRYPLWTTEPTGVIEVERGTKRTLGDFFAVWGQPLGRRRLAGFSGRVRAYVGGRPWRDDPGAIPLTKHAQIVLQVGRYIRPHARYHFPPGL